MLVVTWFSDKPMFSDLSGNACVKGLGVRRVMTKWVQKPWYNCPSCSDELISQVSNRISDEYVREEFGGAGFVGTYVDGMVYWPQSSGDDPWAWATDPERYEEPYSGTRADNE
jgi:hypothetical protein